MYWKHEAIKHPCILKGIYSIISNSQVYWKKCYCVLENIAMCAYWREYISFSIVHRTGASVYWKHAAVYLRQ